MNSPNRIWFNFQIHSISISYSLLCNIMYTLYIRSDFLVRFSVGIFWWDFLVIFSGSFINLIIYLSIFSPLMIEQKGMTFDHNFGYSFPLFSSLLKKRGQKKRRMVSKNQELCLSARSPLTAYLWTFSVLVFL